MLAAGERFILVTPHENPDGDVARVAGGHAGGAVAPAGQGLGHVHGSSDEFPLAYGVPLLRARRWLAPSVVCPTTHESRPTIVSWTACNIDRNPAHELKRDPAPHILNLDHHHDNTRFGTVKPRGAGEASATAEIVWDLMEGARRRADAAGGRGALRRPGHRHREVHVREHRHAARAPDGGRTHRRRRRRASRSTSACTRASPRLSSSCWLAASRTIEALRRGAARRSRTSLGRGLPPDRRRGELLGGRHRPPAFGRRHSGGGARARPAFRIHEPGHAQGVAARLRRPRRRLADRALAQGGGGHRQAAGFSTELSIEEITGFIVSSYAAIPAVHA